MSDKLNQQTIIIPDTSAANSHQTVVVVNPAQGGKSWGVGELSITFGIIGIFILAIIFVPLGIIFGIAAIRKEQTLLGITGITLSIIDIFLSPTFLAIFGLLGR